jgi:hypothetical protein
MKRYVLLQGANHQPELFHLYWRVRCVVVQFSHWLEGPYFKFNIGYPYDEERRNGSQLSSSWRSAPVEIKCTVVEPEPCNGTHNAHTERYAQEWAQSSIEAKRTNCVLDPRTPNQHNSAPKNGQCVQDEPCVLEDVYKIAHVEKITFATTHVKAVGERTS